MYQLPTSTEGEAQPPDATHLKQHPQYSQQMYQPPVQLGQSMQHHTSNVGYQHAQSPILTTSAGTSSQMHTYAGDSGLLPPLTSPLIMPQQQQQYNDSAALLHHSNFQPAPLSLHAPPNTIQPQRQSSFSAQQLQLQAELMGRTTSVNSYSTLHPGYDDRALQHQTSYPTLSADDHIAAPAYHQQQHQQHPVDSVDHWFESDLQLPTRAAPSPLPFDPLTAHQIEPTMPNSMPPGSHPPPTITTLEPTPNINISDFLHGSGSVTLTSLLQNTAIMNANSDPSALRVQSEPTLSTNPLSVSVYDDSSTVNSSNPSLGSTPSLAASTSRNSSEPSSVSSMAKTLNDAHRSISGDSSRSEEDSLVKSKTSGKATRRPTSPTTVATVRKAQYQRHQQLDKERRHRIKAAVDELKKITNSEEQTHAEIIYNACKYVQQQDTTINQAQGVLQQLIQLVQNQQQQITQLQADDNSSTGTGGSGRSSKRRLLPSSNYTVDRQYLSLTDESTRVLYSWIPRPSVARDLEARFRFAKIAAATEYVADVIQDYSRQSGLHPLQMSLMSSHGKLGEISAQGIIVFRVLPNRHILDVNLAGSRVTGYAVEDIHNTHINAAPTCSHNEPLDADDLTHLDDSRYTDGELSVVADELGDKPKTLTQWLLRMSKPRPIVVRSWNRCANGDVLESMPGIVMVRDKHDQPLFLLSVTLPEWARVIPKPKTYYTQHEDSPFSSSQYA